MKNIAIISILSALILSACNVENNQHSQDTFCTKSGKTIEITCIKHASIRLNYGGIEIEFDPVETIEPQTNYDTMPKADYIFVTHEHFDHFDTTAIKKLSKHTTKIITNRNCSEILGRGKAMENGDKIELQGILVEAVPAYNTTPENTKFHPKGRDNGFVLTIDGLRIYVAGDTEDIPEMKHLKNIDIAFLPCNQPYTMTPKQLANAANMIKPKVLYPYHLSETDVNQIVKELEGSDIEIRLRNFK